MHYTRVLFLLLLLSTLASAQPVDYVQIVEGGPVRFQQVSFDFGGGFAYPYSAWGRMQINLDEIPEAAPYTRGYFNVFTDQGWVVQNVEFDLQERMLGDNPSTSTYFQLQDPNNNVTRKDTLSAGVIVSPIPMPTFMSLPQVNFQMPAYRFDAQGVTTLPVTSLPRPPSPAEPTTTTGETFSHYLPNAVNLEAADDQCFPMSMANSLQYLEDRYGLPVPHDHKQGVKGDDSLVSQLGSKSERGVRNRRDGDGVHHIPMLRGKLNYLDENDLEDAMILSHQGRGYGGEGFELPDGDFSVGTVFQVTSKDAGASVTWEWVCDQIQKGEDIEITYSRESATGAIVGGHAVRVYGCGKIDGRPFIKYLHDGAQSDDTRGLEQVFAWMEDVDNDGTLNLGGSAEREIVFAASESVTDEVKNGEFAPPQTLSEQITNAASFLAERIVPGGLSTVFGIYRTLTGGLEQGSTRVSLGSPTPRQVNGLEVLVNGIAAPLFFVGDSQVNFQIPNEIEPGIASLLVTIDGAASDLVTFPVSESAPGTFVLPEAIAGPGRAVAQNQDFSLNVPGAGASAGQAIILYLTGTGPTNPEIPTGMPAPSAEPLARLVLETTATIGGQDATVLFAGAAPGFIGLTQVNLEVPAVAPGDHPVVVTVGGEESNSLLVAVE